MKKNNIQKMTECSVMIALATVLSFFKLAEMPYGGSITVASMLPIVIAVYRNGGRWGLGTALVASAIQLLLGLKNFSYFNKREPYKHKKHGSFYTSMFFD